MDSEVKTLRNVRQRLEGLIARLYGELVDTQELLAEERHKHEKVRREHEELLGQLRRAADRAGLGAHHPVNVVEILTDQLKTARSELDPDYHPQVS